MPSAAVTGAAWSVGVAKGSCAVLPVDAHVLGAQIARPDRGVVRAAVPRSIVDVDLGAAQVSRGARRRLVERQPVAEQHDGADPHRCVREIERHARPPGGRKQTAPVRIAAVHCGLDERRVGDPCAPPVWLPPRSPHQSRGWRPAWSRPHPRGRSSARARGTPPRDLPARAFSASALVDRDAARAARQRHDGVVGGAFAVDRDGVERAIDDRREQRAAAAAGVTSASVVTKPSIVAIIGSIIPAPLAMPPT